MNAKCIFLCVFYLYLRIVILAIPTAFFHCILSTHRRFELSFRAEVFHMRDVM